MLSEAKHLKSRPTETPRSHQTPRLSNPATPDDGAAIIWPVGNSSAVAQSLFLRNASANREFRPFASLRVTG